jgi:hypothetical protein
MGGYFMTFAAETVRTSEIGEKIFSIEEARAIEKDHALAAHYFTVLLKNDVDMSHVRVRTTAYEIDENRHFVLKDGKRQMRNCIDVALDVWGAYGAEDHSLELVMLAEMVMATPKSISDDLMMRRASNMGV